ncbi:MAG: GNAT family N-acetyltransferase [Ruminococcus sp.]|nr:GNAT family N-acetyltransferase [Ruminococcus sp.]
MIFEKADRTDTEALVKLRVEYILADFGDVPAETMAAISDALPDYFNEHLGKDLFAFVCRADDTVAGCCLLQVSEKPPNPSFIHGKTGTVLNVYTRPLFRKKGIAHKLMEMLLNESEKLGLDYVELKATDDGYGLYKSLGFEDSVSKYHNMKYIFSK